MRLQGGDGAVVQGHTRPLPRYPGKMIHLVIQQRAITTEQARKLTALQETTTRPHPTACHPSEQLFLERRCPDRGNRCVPRPIVLGTVRVKRQLGPGLTSLITRTPGPLQTLMG